MFSAAVADSTNLWTVSVSAETGKVTGQPLRLTTTTTGEQLDPWAVAGGRLVFASLVSNYDIWSLPLDTNTGLEPGPLERLTDHPAEDYMPAVTPDGKHLVFRSRRSGNDDFWLLDLEGGGGLTNLTDSPQVEWGAAITADGSKVAYTVVSDGNRELQVQAVGDKVAETVPVPSNFRGVWAWSSDQRRILCSCFGDAGHPSVGLLDVASGENMILLQHPTQKLFQASFSPDGNWVCFQVAPDPSHSGVCIAAFRAGKSISQQEWIFVTDGSTWDDKPRWSPDGNLLYFTSDRDGYRCIYAQRLDPATKTPLENGLIEVQHFHSARRSMMNVDLGRLEISVARDRIVFVLGEATGNIWMGDLTEQ